MTMTEQAPTPAKKTTKPRRRPAKKIQAAPAERTPSEFDGLTAMDCAIACKADHCVISGIGVCMHPCKGGLHASMQMRPDVVRRFNQAKRIVGDQRVTPRDR